MTRKLLPVAVLVALAAVLVLLQEAPSDQARAPTVAPPAEPAASPPMERAAPAFPSADTAPTRLAAAPRDAASGTGGPQPPSAGTTRWLVRVAWPDGRPAAGVPWVLSSTWSHDGAFAARGAAPPADVRGISDAAGLIEVQLEPLAGCWRELSVQPAGAVEVCWQREELDAGRVRDLGSLVLAAGARVSGRVRLAGGAPPPAGTLVHAQPDDGGLTDGPSRPGRSAECDAAGGFSLERVPPGRVLLVVDAPGAAGDTRVPVDLEEGEVRVVDLLAPDADPADQHRIRLAPAVEGVGRLAGPLASHVRLLAPAGPLHPQPMAGWDQLVFEVLDPGEYLVELDDPAWLPARVRARTGPEPTPLPLVGDCALELVVVDAASGAPLEEFGVRAYSLRPDQWRETPSGLAFDVETFPWPVLVPLGLQAQGRALLERLPGHLLRLEVEAPGHVTTRAVWRGAARGGRDTLVVALPLAGRVAGVVVDAEGVPQPGVRVGVFEAPPDGQACFCLDAEEYWAFEPSQGRTCEVLFETRSDEAGRFELELPAAGRGVVRAWRSAGCDVLGPVLVPGAAPPADLRLVLPAAAMLRGRVALPAVVPAERLTLLAVAREPEGAAPRLRAPLATALDAQGGFDCGPARAGTWDVWLACSPARYLDLGPALPAWAGDYARRVGVAQVPLDGELLLVPALADTPGLLEVQVLVDGAQASGLQVSARAASGGSVASGTVVDGRLLLGPAWPGPLVLTVTDPLEGWTHEDPVQPVVPAGAVGAHLTSIVLASGVLRVLDPAGAPRPGALLVAWRRLADGWTWELLRAGPDGRVALRRPEGELRVRLAGADLLPAAPEGEVRPDAFARLARELALLRARAGISGEPPVAPPADAVRVDWRRGVAEVDVVP